MTATAPEDPDILLDSEVASLLRMPLSWVQQAGRDGRLPSMKLGRYRRYSRTAIEQWVALRSSGDPLATDRRTRKKAS